MLAAALACVGAEGPAGEIRVRQGNLRASEPDLIPPAVKVLSLGGEFSSP